MVFYAVLSERIKSAPFAGQACDLVTHDCHFTLLSFSPQDWKLLESIMTSLQPQAEDNIGKNCSLLLHGPQ